MVASRRSDRVLTSILFLLSPFFAAAPLLAQDGMTVGLGFGPIAAYPDDFVGTGCDGRSVGANVGARRTVSPSVALEMNVTWTGTATTSCSADALSRPAPEDGTEYRHAILPDAIRGETFWATRAGAVVTPWEVGGITTLFRVTAGRLWSKGLWTWTAGAGVRYSFGRQGVVLDIERWHLGYDVIEETWTFRQNATDDLLGREMIERRPRPWFVRLGWEWTVGG